MGTCILCIYSGFWKIEDMLVGICFWGFGGMCLSLGWLGIWMLDHREEAKKGGEEFRDLSNILTHRSALASLSV